MESDTEIILIILSIYVLKNKSTKVNNNLMNIKICIQILKQILLILADKYYKKESVFYYEQCCQFSAFFLMS